MTDLAETAVELQKWEELKARLQTEVLEVTFTKKDGTERTMQCTLKEDLLPKVEVDESAEKKEREINVEVMPVWDLEKAAWRSFRMDSIKGVENV